MAQKIKAGAAPGLSRIFRRRDQLRFARLSGDYNPLHLDPLAARRSLFGGPVVHGIHAVLWALERWAAGGTAPLRLRGLKAQFLRPIHLDAPVTLAVGPARRGETRLTLEADGALLASLWFSWAPAPPRPAARLDSRAPARRSPRALGAGDMAGARGRLALHRPAELARIFPRLSRRLPPIQVATLLATTRLVGMECPGLQSVYSGLELAAAAEGREDLFYEVTAFDPRFGLASIALAAPGLRGSIRAFLRPLPRAQADPSALRRRVKPREFAGQRALVIGGSRGLGEAAAKLLAAGGAEVRLTYRRGKADAARVVREIRRAGGRAAAAAFDVLAIEPGSLKARLRGFRPTHFYYFATPFIFSGAKGVFSPRLFREFSDYYVAGFAAALAQARELGAGHAFYPSSSAVDESPADMAEYAAAKSAGESLCLSLEKNTAGLILRRPRLPRLATDQTASLLPVANGDPVPALLSALRAFPRAAGRKAAA